MKLKYYIFDKLDFIDYDWWKRTERNRYILTWIVSLLSVIFSIFLPNQKLRNNTRDNIIFIFLGAFFGIIGSLCTNQLIEYNRKQELEELHNQLLEIKLQLSNLQKYQSKKDSLQTSLKKN